MSTLKAVEHKFYYYYFAKAFEILPIYKNAFQGGRTTK